MHTYIYIRNAYSYVLQAWVYVRVCVTMYGVRTDCTQPSDTH